MKRLTLSAVLLFAGLSVASAQLFLHHKNDSGPFTKILMGPDASYYLIGSFGNGAKNIQVVKYTPYGTTHWGLSLGGKVGEVETDDKVVDAALDFSGNLVVLAEAFDYVGNSTYAYMAQIDNAGVPVWQSTFRRGTSALLPTALDVDPGSGVTALAGYTVVNGGTRAIAAQVTAAGATAWIDEYVETGFESKSFDVAILPTLEVATIGCRTQPSSTLTDVSFRRFSPAGARLQNTTISDFGNERGFILKRSIDGFICLAARESGNPQPDYLVHRIGNSGLQWSLSYEYPELQLAPSLDVDTADALARAGRPEGVSRKKACSIIRKK